MPNHSLPRSWAATSSFQVQDAHRCYAYCRVVARETGFTVIDHALGFTAIRENDGGPLLFCLSTGEWSIFNGQTAKVIASGYGLASFLTAARQYFNLPAETADAVEREYAA